MADTTKTSNKPGEQDRQRQEIKRLRSTCALYDKYAPRWQYYLDAYEGGNEFATNKAHLFRHFRENDADYKDRVKRAHYLNYCEALVDFFTDFIFADAIVRTAGKDDAADTFYHEFLMDVNKKGEDVDTFMRQVCEDMQIFGMCYVLVDSPKIGTRLTKLQEKTLGVRPYWVLIRPDEILDWIVDAFDQLQYMKRQQIVETLVDGVKKTVERYTEWTPDNVTISDIDISLGEAKPVLGQKEVLTNAMKEVPVSRFFYKRTKKDRAIGKSFLVDLADNNREVLNLTSLIGEFLYRQCFNMLAMEDDTTETDEDSSQAAFGPSNVLLFPRESKHAPHYVSPPSDPAKILQLERDKIVAEMYKRSHQDMVNDLFNGGKASGHSKQMSFSTTVPKIAQRADVLERGEQRLMALTYKYRSAAWAGKIKYKDRYEITNLTDSLAQLQTLFSTLQIGSATFIQDQLIRMVHEFDGKMSPDTRKTIEAEINAMDMNEYVTTQKLAFLGRASLSDLAGQAVDGSDATALSLAAASKSAPVAAAPTRKPSTTAELSSESTKVAKPGGRKAAGKK